MLQRSTAPAWLARLRRDRRRADGIPRMDIAEFRRLGFLQEINRLVLHPAGLALEVQRPNSGPERFGGVWDYSDDPEGILYADETIDPERIATVARHVRLHAAERIRQVGSVIQGPPAETALDVPDRCDTILPDGRDSDSTDLWCAIAYRYPAGRWTWELVDPDGTTILTGGTYEPPHQALQRVVDLLDGIVYAATIVGVYDHGVIGIFTTPDAAEQAAHDALVGSDGYHRIRIDKVRLKTPIDRAITLGSDEKRSQGLTAESIDKLRFITHEDPHDR